MRTFTNAKEIFQYLTDILLLRDTEKSSGHRSFRFFLLAVTSFLTYVALYGLKGLSIEQIDSLLSNSFSSFPWFLLNFIYLLGGLMSLYLSLVSVSLFNSLLPNHS